MRPRKEYKLSKFREKYPDIKLFVLSKNNKKDSLIRKFMATREVVQKWASD